ncbi:MAG TPA: Crp/Fnr family transcriptional regulator [Mesorhizobium sp.]|jgi:CRP-like cAMP-binding protein|nr:Crp/Fnr family transcriptional regulator [Mesorhizobium sp.]
MMTHSEQVPIPMKGSAIHLLIERLSAGTLLAEPERQALAEASTRTVVVARDQTLARPGQNLTDCHVLASGLAAAYKLLPDGKRQIVGFLLPGDFVDLEAYVSETMDYSVTALSSCSLAVIPHAVLRRLSADHPSIALALWRETLLNAAIHREWVVNVGQRMASERLAHLICEMSARLESRGLARDEDEGKSFTWPVTQADIADATGMSTVHVNRTIQELRARELIRFRQQEVTVLDWPGLQNLAGFDPDYLLPASKRPSLHLQ